LGAGAAILRRSTPSHLDPPTRHAARCRLSRRCRVAGRDGNARSIEIGREAIGVRSRSCAPMCRGNLIVTWSLETGPLQVDFADRDMARARERERRVGQAAGIADAQRRFAVHDVGCEQSVSRHAVRVHRALAPLAWMVRPREAPRRTACDLSPPACRPRTLRGRTNSLYGAVVVSVKVRVLA
jgi:hypothetical protein